MIDAIGRRLQPLYGTDQTLAAGHSFPIQEANLLNLLTRLLPEDRAEVYSQIKDQFKDGSLPQQVALFLLRQPQKPIDPLARDQAIWLLESCGIKEEAEQLSKEFPSS